MSDGLISLSIMFADVGPLPAVNASLNGLATVLLILGYFLIKQGEEKAHIYTMLIAFGVSVVFLVCYLIHHYQVGSVKFTGPQPIRTLYFVILVSHVILAAAVPVLVLLTIYRGYKDQREKHKKIAKWTFPIWLYVSITGVIIYLMVYQLYPPGLE